MGCKNSIFYRIYKAFNGSGDSCYPHLRITKTIGQFTQGFLLLFTLYTTSDLFRFLRKYKLVLFIYWCLLYLTFSVIFYHWISLRLHARLKIKENSKFHTKAVLCIVDNNDALTQLINFEFKLKNIAISNRTWKNMVGRRCS